MTRILRLEDEAADELEAAATWSEARRARLGLEFVLEVRAGFAKITEHPRASSLDPDVPAPLQ